MNPSQDARAYLFGLELHGIKLGLDNIRRLLGAAGDPQDAYPTVHVAGTNGKGSVVAFLGAMLEEAGYRVGRFTSPHLIRVNERFLINRSPISDTELDRQIDYFRALARTLGIIPTFFELNTAIAFRHFALERVDVAVIETGMGGRLDSTNVLRPLATAVTNIALEHTQFLGDTPAKIAAEKAGIFKAHTPAIIGETDEEPLSVLLAHAARAGADARRIGEHFTGAATGDAWHPVFSYQSERLSLNAVPLGIPGLYQRRNAAVAVALAEAISRPASPLQVSVPAMEAGLRAARWPGRLERVLEDPVVIIDVAHNAAGAASLACVLERCVLVLAVSADKDAAAMLGHLRPRAGALILTQFQGGRSMPAQALQALAGGAGETALSMESALERAFERAAELSLPIVITGSIFAAGEAREVLIRRHGVPQLAF